jgi:hypothetical protein
MKLLYAHPLLEFFNGLGQTGAMSFGMSIIGYSLPDHDDYLRQILYCLSRNYFDGEGWAEEVFGRRKSRVTIVDFCPSEEKRSEMRRRYRFLFPPRKRTRLVRGGFDGEAVKAIFGNA